MVNFGNGFTWSEVYFMPVHWRRFYFKKLVEAKKKEKEDKISKFFLFLYINFWFNF